MNNSIIKYFSIAVTALSLSCSSGDDSTPVPTPTPTPTPTPVTDALTTQNAKDYVVDKNATTETLALFYNLKKLAKTKIAIGQQDAFGGFYNDVKGDSDIKKTTGNDPAVFGSDFMFITDKNNNGKSDNWFYQQEVSTIKQVKEAYAKGIVNIFCWHLREPNKEDSFYASDMTTEQKNSAFRSILPGGVNHDWYKLKLDKVASVISNLKGANGELIPVIFRPFHEFDGSWFWWGANFCSAAEYKQAFQFTVDYLKNTKGVHSILYAFSPDNSYGTEAGYLSRYPGDAYVDVLGMDNYGDFNNQGQTGADKANAKLKIISDLAKTKVKIAALTETGYQVTSTKTPIAGWFSNYLYGALTANNIEISFAMFWGNGGANYYVPTPSNSNVQDFKDFVGKPKSALLPALPKMYEMPK